MSYARKAIRGVSTVFFFNILAALFAYLLRVLLARNLGPAEYGLFYAVFTLVVFFLFFRNLGVDQALVKYIPDFLVKKDLSKIKTAVFSAFAIQTSGSIILSTVFLLLSGWLAQNYFHEPQAQIILYIVVLYILLSPLFYIPKKLLNGFQKYALVSAYECTKNFLVLSLSLLLLWFGFKTSAPAWAYVIACILLPILFIIPILKTGIFKAKFAPLKPIASQLILFGLPVILANIGGKVIGYTDTLILTAFRSLEEVGTYNVVLPTAMMLLFLGSLSTVLFPMASELWARQDLERLKKGVKLLHTYAFSLTIPLIFSIFAYAPLVLKILFGKEYLDGALSLQILLVGIVCYLVANINHSIISATGEPKKVTVVILTAAIVNVIINLALIPIYGINGAAIATTSSYALALFFSTFLVAKKIKTPYPLATWAKIAFCGLLFVLVVQYIKTTFTLPLIAEIITSLTAGTLVYIILLRGLRVISLSEIKFYAIKAWKGGPKIPQE